MVPPQTTPRLASRGIGLALALAVPLGCGARRDDVEEACPASEPDGTPDNAGLGDDEPPAQRPVPTEDDDEVVLVCPDEVRVEITSFVYECVGGAAPTCEEVGSVQIGIDVSGPDETDFLIDAYGWATEGETLGGNDGFVASTRVELQPGNVAHVDLSYLEEGPCRPLDFDRASVFLRLDGRSGIFAVDAETARSQCG